MPKKILHIVVTLVLVLATGGVTFSMHYCGGQRISTSINHHAKSCCGNDGCCHNKTVHIQVKDHFKSNDFVHVDQAVAINLMFAALFLFDAVPELPISQLNKEVIDTSPPISIQTRLSLLQTYLC